MKKIVLLLFIILLITASAGCSETPLKSINLSTATLAEYESLGSFEEAMKRGIEDVEREQDEAREYYDYVLLSTSYGWREGWIGKYAPKDIENYSFERQQPVTFIFNGIIGGDQSGSGYKVVCYLEYDKEDDKLYVNSGVMFYTKYSQNEETIRTLDRDGVYGFLEEILER